MSEVRIQVRRDGENMKLTTVPKAARILEDAVGIAAQQLEKLRIKSNLGQVLSPQDLKNFKIYIECICALSREERERMKSDKLGELYANMSDDELLALYKQAASGKGK